MNYSASTVYSSGSKTPCKIACTSTSLPDMYSSRLPLSVESRDTRQLRYPNPLPRVRRGHVSRPSSRSCVGTLWDVGASSLSITFFQVGSYRSSNPGVSSTMVSVRYPAPALVVYDGCTVHFVPGVSHVTSATNLLVTTGSVW